MTNKHLFYASLFVALAIFVGDVGTALLFPDFYSHYMTSELGFVENAQVVVLAIGLLYTLYLSTRRRLPPYLRGWLTMMLLCYIYLLGEEISWGQHFVGWTADGWFVVNNDQLETNVHNTSSWLDQKPRMLLLLGVVLGGIIHPLLVLYRGKGIFNKPWWMAPTFDIFPLSVMIMVPQLVKHITKAEIIPLSFGITNLRYSETQELLLYVFFVAYLVSLHTRLRARAHS